MAIFVNPTVAIGVAANYAMTVNLGGAMIGDIIPGGQTSEEAKKEREQEQQVQEQNWPTFGERLTPTQAEEEEKALKQQEEHQKQFPII